MRRSEIFKFLVHSVEGKVAQQRMFVFLTQCGRLVEHHGPTRLHVALSVEVTTSVPKESDVLLALSIGGAFLKHADCVAFFECCGFFAPTELR